MKLIKPKFEILEQQPEILGLYKQIELAERTLNTYNMNYE